MPQWLPALLLAAHLVYLLFIPSLLSRAVSAIGCLVSLALVFVPLISPAFGDRARTELRVVRGWRLLPPLVCFALPLLSFIGHPTLAFMRLDAAALLVIAWLTALSWVLLAQHAAPGSFPHQSPSPHLPVVTQLFVLWSALFWLTVIWDLGVGHAVMAVNREDRLTASFALWERQPATEHLFLVWLTPESFEHRVAYTNHLHPVLFFWYGCSKFVQLATGLPMYVGRNLTPFAVALVGVLAFAALIPRRSSSSEYTVKFHATLFLAVGFFLSEWHFWVYPYVSNFDSVFPLISLLAAFVWASAHPRIGSRNARHLTAALVVFAAFGWVYTPLLVVAVWCLFGRVRAGVTATIAANRPLVSASIAAVAVGAAIYSLPIVLVTLKGYDRETSSYLFRSGLDGDTRYFHDVVQAVARPFAPARTWWSLLFPASVPFIAAGACASRQGGIMRRRFGRQSVFFLAPYVFSVALFPQAVSIHPYLYDALLLVPAVLLGSSWTLTRCVQDRLRGASGLAALLVAAILLMANLIAIAQGMLRLKAG
jgi:hypothetical protein